MVHSTHRVDLQLINTFNSLQSICTLAQHWSVQIEYLRDILHSPPLKRNVELLSPAGETPIELLLSQLIEPHTSAHTTIPKYYRLKMNNIMYHSVNYERPKKINDSVIAYKTCSSKDNFGLISYFVYLDHKHYAIVKQFTNVHPIISSIHHVLVCEKTPGPTEVISIEAIIGKVVFMSFSDTENVYIATFPNCIESD